MKVGLQLFSKYIFWHFWSKTLSSTKTQLNRGGRCAPGFGDEQLRAGLGDGIPVARRT